MVPPMFTGEKPDKKEKKWGDFSKIGPNGYINTLIKFALIGKKRIFPNRSVWENFV
jgi:hypothetical protein